MHDIVESLPALARGGLGNLAAYLAAHVLLCLLPAFFIAGAMTALIPKEAVTRFLGRGTPRYLSYPAAAVAGSVLAVCSCTIVPLFAGIHRKGAGIGPAITFLFFAPAANVLALVYTGNVLGADLALARLLLSLAFGVGIGMIMALIFQGDDAAHDRETDALFASQSERGLTGAAAAVLIACIALLLVGTLKVPALAASLLRVDVAWPGAGALQRSLLDLVPFDPARGEEGVSAHGALLVLLLVGVGFASWLGLRRIHDGVSGWTRTALVLIVSTLLIASLRVEARDAGVAVDFTGRSAGVLAVVVVLMSIARRRLPRQDLLAWLWESWRFARQIFPLLIVGVFFVGALRVVIDPAWIESLAGENTVLANAAGVAFGVIMYFPTLVEVPVAKMFLDLGMHRGPLLAYLMADPELSLQSILVLTAILGKGKTWTYVALVAAFSALGGLAYGAWIDGASGWLVAAMVALGLLVLSGALRLANGHVAIGTRSPIREKGT